MVISTKQADLVLLTAEGLVRCRLQGAAETVDVLGTALDGEVMREVCHSPADPRVWYAATSTDVFRSDDAGETWTLLPSGGIDLREIWTMSVHPTRPNEVYVGTMPAAVYVSDNGGLSFRELSSFRSLPEYARWTFPPPPHSAHIRSIVLDARAPDEILVGVEEGGVARSRDAGKTWEDISGPPSDTALPAAIDPTGRTPYQPGKVEEGRVYRDVHTVLRHPAATDAYYAATGMGTYRSMDGGKHWNQLGAEAIPVYSVVMAAHPDAPDRLFVGAAKYSPPAWKGYRGTRPGPFNVSRFGFDLYSRVGGAHSTVFRSLDGGDTWQPLGNGLPADNPGMTCTLAVHPEDPDMVLVAYTDGEVYVSRDGGDSWRQLEVSHPKLYGARILVGG